MSPAENPPAERTKRAAGGRGGGANGTRRRNREVLEAAAKVFYSQGYAEASVQDIADELGILKGSLYHYIESKEDLLFWLLTETHDDVQAILDEVAGDPELEPLAALREYVRRQVEYTSRNLPRMSIYYHDSGRLSRQRHQELIAKRHAHETFVTGLIEAAQGEGGAAAGDPRLTANFVFGSMIWIYRWYKPGGSTKPADLADRCADFVLNGVIGGPRR